MCLKCDPLGLGPTATLIHIKGVLKRYTGWFVEGGEVRPFSPSPQLLRCHFYPRAREEPSGSSLPLGGGVRTGWVRGGAEDLTPMEDCLLRLPWKTAFSG